MSDAKFIIWHDTLGSEANTVECLSYEGKESAVSTPLLALVILSSFMTRSKKPTGWLKLVSLSGTYPSKVCPATARARSQSLSVSSKAI